MMLGERSWWGEGWITKIKPSTTALRWKEQKRSLQTVPGKQKAWQRKHVLGVEQGEQRASQRGKWQEDIMAAEEGEAKFGSLLYARPRRFYFILE